ncbi:MAG: glycosyltransferase family 2 protein [Chitinophagaceae bacterium]
MSSISIIIITYNRPADCLALLQNLALLEHKQLLTELVLLNNASTADYQIVTDWLTQNPTALPVKYIESSENLGVTRGRNKAMQFATGNILVFLDDDAELAPTDALLQIQRAFTRKGYQNKPIGIVSFKVVYHSTGFMQVNALPHKNFNKYHQKQHFFTYYFAGGAHAIKKEIFELIGLLPENFFYGMEEYDVSYRVLDAGWCIAYDDSIVMLHKESPLGRKPTHQKLQSMWVNKCIVAYTYLPIRYFYSTAFMWALNYLKVTGFHMGGFIHALRQIIAIPKHTARKPLKPSTLAYLKSVEARLWY